MVIKERQFNTEVRNSLEAAGAWAYKIPDSPIFPGMQTRFTGAKPCDIVGGYLNHFFAIESKQIKKFEAFGISAFRYSQIEQMDKMLEKGNQAFAFLNVRIAKPHFNRLIIFDWEDGSWKGKPEKSCLKKFDIEELAMQEGIVGKKGIFDLEPFLSELSCGMI